MRERRAVEWTVVLIAVWTGAARSQPPTSPPPGRAAGATTVTDTGTRFKFIERYAVESDPAKRDALTQYRVAVMETIKSSAEKAQGAPERSEVVFRTIYTERAARVGSGAAVEVLDAVRRYDNFHPVPDRSRPKDYRPLEGLTVWYHPRAGDEPQILSLTERHLTDQDYLYACHHIFLPDLRGLLPTQPSPVGESWAIPVTALRALLCDPSARGRTLSGKLVDVREEKAAEGPAQWVAVIAVSGRASLALTGETAINAELDFRFTPPARAGAAEKGAEADGSKVEARGYISELRMAVSRTAPASANPKERLRQTTTWESVLQRRPSTDATPLLSIPNPAPAPTEANSWLTLVPPADPAVPGYTFRHPQELLPPPGMRPTADTITLWDRWPEPRDELTFQLAGKSDQPSADRQLRDPEYHRKELLTQWQKERLEVVQGPHDWLPAAEWSQYNMKVWRMQAAIKETRPETRRMPRSYVDFYLVLFGRDQCLLVNAVTSQDPPAAFRKQTEAILKTFQFDSSRPKR